MLGRTDHDDLPETIGSKTEDIGDIFLQHLETLGPHIFRLVVHYKEAVRERQRMRLYTTYWEAEENTDDAQNEFVRSEQQSQTLLNMALEKHSPAAIASDTKFLAAVCDRNKASLHRTDTQLDVIKDHINRSQLFRSSVDGDSVQKSDAAGDCVLIGQYRILQFNPLHKALLIAVCPYHNPSQAGQLPPPTNDDIYHDHFLDNTHDFHAALNDQYIAGASLQPGDGHNGLGYRTDGLVMQQRPPSELGFGRGNQEYPPREVIFSAQDTVTASSNQRGAKKRSTTTFRPYQYPPPKKSRTDKNFGLCGERALLPTGTDREQVVKLQLEISATAEYNQEAFGKKWAASNWKTLYLSLSEPCRFIMLTCKKHARAGVQRGFNLRPPPQSTTSEPDHQAAEVEDLLDSATFPPKYVFGKDETGALHFLENHVVWDVLLNTVRELKLYEYVTSLKSLFCTSAAAVKCALRELRTGKLVEIPFSGIEFKSLHDSLEDYIDKEPVDYIICAIFRSFGKRWSSFKVVTQVIYSVTSQSFGTHVDDTHSSRPPSVMTYATPTLASLQRQGSSSRLSGASSPASSQASHHGLVTRSRRNGRRTKVTHKLLAPRYLGQVPVARQPLCRGPFLHFIARKFATSGSVSACQSRIARAKGELITSDADFKEQYHSREEDRAPTRTRVEPSKSTITFCHP
ncbi:uncharacterized protein F5891DRAFT_989699 [Suillus fuscotomentosus]|uniref:Uncharacterized protein n=1 Tax=Suillus fuscotomentosus TaxID=1912939 RepID=A0AAD4DNB9_9AGAM|nr:uncharacterized protein F5891DRAFT_989699 [Suillus fuscotomentosus]KAG1885329.1 hypothetical protein F5891DRAFT_989699 [Suillus fuscotomentosus]